MRRHAFVIVSHLCLLPVLLPASAHADDMSRIARVTLYPGAATVERSAQVAAGATRLELSGLPAAFDAKTIRVEADPGIRIGEVTVQDVARSEAMGKRQAELEAKLQDIEDQIAMLDVERQSAELVTGYLKGLGGGSEDGKATPLDTRTLAATLDAIRKGGSDAYATMQRVAVKKRALEQQADAVRRDLEQVTGSARAARSVTVRLAAERAGEVRVAYQVNGPGWQPVYRATLDAASGKVELERQALIAQNSGEDWNGVVMRLSTDQPRSAPQGPTPYPWQLSIRPPAPPRPLAAAPMAAPAPMAKAELMRAREADAEMPLFDVAELQGAFSTEYEVPGKVTLPSDGRKVTVSLARQSLPVKLRVQALPRRDTTAYVVAEADKPQGVWLPGEIQLRRDGSYVGSTRWNPQAEDKLTLPFGRDDQVRISVAHLKTMSGESGIIAQRGERELQDVYTVSNLHKQPVDLLLLESSPVSTDEKIGVDKRFDPKPSEENWQDKPGVVAWRQSLPAGGTQKFSVDYRISWPKDASVIGLP